MATFVYKDAYVSLGGNDLSAAVHSATFNDGIESGDATAMGSDTRINKGGLKTPSLQVEFYVDFAAGLVDATIAGLTAREGALIFKPNGATTGTTNPKWTGTALVSDYTVVGGSVGDTPAKGSMTLLPATTWTRATSD